MRAPHIVCALLLLLGAQSMASAQNVPQANTVDTKALPAAPKGIAPKSGVTASSPSASSPSDQGPEIVETMPQTDVGATAKPLNTTDLIANLTIFILAIFVGFEVIVKVSPTLHTPLMSGSNAISGITLVGAIVIAGAATWGAEPVIGFVAVVLATINVVGGFVVTNRMLRMFQRK